MVTEDRNTFSVEIERDAFLADAERSMMTGQVQRAISRVNAALALVANDARALIIGAQAMFAAGKLDNCKSTVDHFHAHHAPSATSHELLAMIAARQGQAQLAIHHARESLRLNPENPTMANILAQGVLRSVPYKEVLLGFHKALKPSHYLEIGVYRGEALQLAGPETKAVAVDPDPHSLFKCPANATLFKTTSDDFFASHAPGLNVAFDMIFVDGLHEAKQAFRDIINAERYATRDGAILVHDVVPLFKEAQMVQRKTLFWTGDVWKSILCLKEQCPDLSVEIIPAPPSGLALIKGLNPDRNFTQENMKASEASISAMSYDAMESSLMEKLNVPVSQIMQLEEVISKHLQPTYHSHDQQTG